MSNLFNVNRNVKEVIFPKGPRVSIFTGSPNYYDTGTSIPKLCIERCRGVLLHCISSFTLVTSCVWSLMTTSHESLMGKTSFTLWFTHGIELRATFIECKVAIGTLCNGYSIGNYLRHLPQKVYSLYNYTDHMSDHPHGFIFILHSVMYHPSPEGCLAKDAPPTKMGKKERANINIYISKLICERFILLSRTPQFLSACLCITPSSFVSLFV